MYMSSLIREDCPKNAKELKGLIGDFLTDGMCHSDEEAFKMCQLLQKAFIEKKLIEINQRDTIIAEKLSKPIQISELAQTGHSGVVREDDFYDPLLAGEKPTSGGNYNVSEDKKKWKEKKDARWNKLTS